MELSDESQKNLLYWDAKQRLYLSLQRAWPGVSGPEVIPELQSLVAEMEDLLAKGLPRFVEASAVSYEMAEAETRIAHMASWVGDVALAKSHAIRASRFYQSAGRPDLARDFQNGLPQDEIRSTGNFGREYGDLMEVLAQVPPGSLDHSKALIDLGDLYLSIGDEFEAGKRLQEAEQELSSSGHEPPTAEQILEALRAMFDLHEATPEQITETSQRLQALSKAHDLHKHVYLSLAYVHRKKDPERAQHYSRLVRELASREPTPDLLQTMLKRAETARRNRERELYESWRTSDDKLRNILGEPAFEECFGPLRREQEEADFVRELLRKRWHERTDANPFVIQLDLDRLWERDALAAIEQASVPEGEIPEELLEARARETDAARKTRNPETIVRALLRQADLFIKAGREDEAVTVLTEGRGILKEVAQHDLGAYILSRFAEIHARRQDWPTVASLCEEGIELVESYRFRVTPPYLQNAYMKARIGLYSAGVRAAWELGQWDRMTEWADLSKSRTILGYSRLPKVPSEDLIDLEQAFRSVCDRIDSILDPPRELLQQRRVLWERIFLAKTARRAELFSSGLDLDAIRSDLDEDEAFLYYYWLDKRSFLIVTLDRDRIRQELRTLSPEQRETLERFRRVPIPSSSRGFRLLPSDDREGMESRESGPSLEEDLESLSLPLLPDAAAFEGKKRLIISPHRLLHAVPFQALRWKGDFLIRRFAITYVPNLGSMMLRYTAPENRHILAVGTRDYDLVRSLRMAEEEIKEIEGLYKDQGTPVTVLRRDGARKRRIVEIERTGEIRTFTCLHFALHGSNTVEDAPMESRLFLRDTVLNGIEIGHWSLEAELVVLSACWSGKRPVSGRGLEELPGDEMFGLQAAFFAAGAKRVLGALWPAHDRTAYELMVRFHRSLAEGHFPEVALQRAVLFHLDGAAGARKILLWAPFFLSCLGRPTTQSRKGTG
ncbi:MAG TPA: CHAT domain-containing protein [Thermoanaerobaculia bacterium]|nr:CHAT domain-containing protein [Thermoanaerobaculia bacterium]